MILLIDVEACNAALKSSCHPAFTIVGIDMLIIEISTARIVMFF